MARHAVQHRRRPFTYGDYAAMPDDGKRYEVLDGELEMTPSPMTRHQKTVLALARRLSEHVERRNLGQVFVAPFDVVLSPTNVVQPDIVFVSRARSKMVTEKNIQGAPDLLVEVVSPASAVRDRIRKARIYARLGVPHFWLVDPEAGSIETFALEGGAYKLDAAAAGNETLRPSLFPGLSIRLARLFE